MAGVRVDIRGIAFQQQDQGTSACATTALWSAIQKTANHDSRTPSPAEITRLATTYALPGGRALPSDGLVISQMCEAIRGVGLAPYLYRNVDSFTTRELLHLAIASGLPAIAVIKDLKKPLQHPEHAITLVGGRFDFAKPAKFSNESFGSRAMTLAALYVHDDRLGPYITAELIEPLAPSSAIVQTAPVQAEPEPVPDGRDVETVSTSLPAARTPAVSAMHLRFIGDTPTDDGPWQITSLLFPLHHKIRISQKVLFGIALMAAHRLGEVLKNKPWGDSLAVYETRILRGTEYVQELLSVGLLTNLQSIVVSEELALSNYVGVVRLGLKTGNFSGASEIPLLDIVVDTTGTEIHSPVLALIELICPPELRVELLSIAEVYPTARLISSEGGGSLEAVASDDKG